MNPIHPSSAAFFERMYQQSADPWHFSEDPAELSRYDATMAALQGRCFRHACEPGCSVGVLTGRLAQVSVRVDAYDFSETAVEEARVRCAYLPNVRVTCAAFPNSEVDSNDVDLLVLSEVGYYFSPQEWQSIVAKQVEQLPQGATLLAVHWLGSSPDHQMHGDQVHAILAELPQLSHELGQRFSTFRLDRWVKR